MASVVAVMQPCGVASSRSSGASSRVAFRPFSRSLAAQPMVAAAAPLVAARRPALAVSATAAAAPAAQQKIRIKLKSYWVDLLQDSVEKIREAASSTGASIAGPVPLPTRCARAAAPQLAVCTSSLQWFCAAQLMGGGGD